MSAGSESRAEQEEEEEGFLNPTGNGGSSLSSLHIDLQHLTEATFGLDVPAQDRLVDIIWEDRSAIACLVLLVISGVIYVAARSTSNTAEEHELRMNQIQMLGTHNSYHIAPSPQIMAALQNIIPDWVDGLAYTHRSLPEQLAAGYRHFELDVYYDPDGGLYSHRAILGSLGLPTASNDPRLDQPGFKVFHISDIDTNSSCVTFVECLQLIKKFSDEHPDHLPISIKTQGEQTAPHVVENEVTPIPITSDVLLALEREILSVFSRSRIVTPDDVQGRPRKKKHLRWPKLKDARGKILFLLITNPSVEEYLKIPHSPSGRVMFPAYCPSGDGDRHAWNFHALCIEEASPLSATAIARGRYVIGRADAYTHEARAGNFTRAAAHFRHGTQVIQTDYPAFEAPNPFGTAYTVMFGGNVQARCNPVNAPGWCFAEESDLLREGEGEGARSR